MFVSLVLLSGLLAAPDEARPAAKTEASAAKADPELASKVRRLLRQLDAPQLAERDRAEDELLKLGPAILDLLPKEPDPSRPEVGQRVGRIRGKLQRKASTATLAPSTVTLQGTMPLSKVLAAIQEQTGNKFADIRKEGGDNFPDRDVTVDFNKTPFWQALDQVLDQAKWTINVHGEEKAIQVAPVLQPEPPRAGRASYRGPFRVQPTTILAQRDLRRLEADSLKLEVEIAWEPRLAPITLHVKMSDIQATDENGRPLVIERQEADLEIPIEPDRIAKVFTVPLALPPRDVKQIGRLKGTITAMVAGKVETFRFSDLEKAKNVEKRAAGVTVVVEDVRKAKQLWEVYTAVRFDNAGDALASHRTWVTGNPAVLEDKNGKTVASGSSEMTRHSENEVGVVYIFFVEGPIGDYTFVYQTPGMVLSAPFEFELKGIQLP